jgi:hypothetical protein
MHTCKETLGFPCYFIVVALAFFNLSAVGMILYNYDLDSLVYMSPQIVEGRLGSEHRRYNLTIREFKVSQAYKGSLKIGDSIEILETMSLDSFCKPIGESFKRGKLQDGDQLFLFLGRASSGGYFMPFDIRTNAEFFITAPSGVRLVIDGKVVDFFQETNPGPYVARTRQAATNAMILTAAEFRQQIKESLARVDEWRPLLEKEATKQDIPELLTLLRERKRLEFGEQDEIAETICNRLVKLREPAALLEAVRIRDSFHEAFILGTGLGTPAGRALLLRKIADAGEPLRDRIQWATMLGIAGITYRQLFREHDNDSSWSAIGITKESNTNEHFYRRIAELATTNNINRELQLKLFSSLQQLANGPVGSDLILVEDGSDVCSILRSFLRNTESEQLKYEAELVLAALDGRYSESKFGPVLSILKPGPYSKANGKLHFAFSYKVLGKENWQMRIALLNLRNGQKWVFAAPMVVSGHGGGNGSDSIVLPPDFPHGRYRVFLEFFDGDKILCAGHFFETDL